VGSVALAADKAELRGVGHFTVPGWFKQSFLDLPEDVKEASRGGKRLLLYFGQEGCPYCAELFNNNFSQRHIVEYTQKNFDAIALDIWGDREVTDFSGRKLPEKEFAASLKVLFTPTLLFIDEKGETILRINGYYAPHQFMVALRYVAEKQEKRLSFRDYLAKQTPPPARGTLHSQPFFAKPPYDLSKVSADRPIAVFFEQKDCAGCDQVHKEILNDPATQESLKRFQSIQLDRWSDTPVVTPAGRKTTAREWANELNIAYVPSAVFFDDGKEVIKIEAFLKGFHMQSVLEFVATGAYKKQPELQRFIRERAERLREQGQTVDLWR
jgi:thioredoxin-related protein